MGFFDHIFDFDNNGKVDSFEMALGYELFPRATQNYYGEEAPPDDFDFDFDFDDEDDPEDEEELAEYFDSMQTETRSERRENAHSVSTDISCLIAELEDLQTRIQNAKSDLETLLDIERDIHLELPDSLSCSDYETEMESAIDSLEDAVRCLDSADSDIGNSLSQLEDASNALDMMDY